MNQNKRLEQKTGESSLVGFGNLPIFHFDLAPVLERTGSPILRDSSQLKRICEDRLLQIGHDQTIVHTATGFYLIVQSTSGEAAYKIADRLNTELLALFFGGAEIPERFERLYRPAEVDAPHLRVVNEDTATETSAEKTTTAESRLAEGGASGREARDAYTTLAIHGTLPAQHVELVFEPVHDLVRARSTTFFCTPAFCVGGAPVVCGYAAFEDAGRRDRPLIDRAMLVHSLKFARRLAQSGVFAAVGTPVSFDTLASARAREIYQEALQAGGVPDYPSIVLCIKDLPVGVTASRIAEFAGHLRPLSKSIFVHLPEMNPNILNCGYLGANGFVLTLPPKQSITHVERLADSLARVCETQTALSCIDQIDSEGALEVVKRTSIRFGMGGAFGPTLFRGNTPPAEVDSFIKAAAREALGSGRNVHRLATMSRMGERRIGHSHN